MRNLKRVLSLALALVMVLGMMVITTSAATFTDAEEITNVEAVEVLAALGIVQGSNGKFDPNGTFTREAAAKLLTYMLIGPDMAEKLAGTNVFTDVAADRWSAGYISYCANLGYITGVGNDKFNPTGVLTDIELGKLVLCAIGYDAANYVGTNWAAAVTVDMLEAGLVKNVTGTAISREDACAMILAGLKSGVEVKEYVVTTGGEEFVFDNQTDALLYYVVSNDATIETVEYTTDSLLDEVYDAACFRGTDNYGRPATVYTCADWYAPLYFVDAPVLTFTTEVKGGALYTALGKPNANYYSYKAVVDGKDAADIENVVVSGGKASVANTANGVLTEVYKTGKYEYTVVSMNTYLGYVADYTEQKTNADGQITVHEAIEVAGVSAPGALNGYFRTGDFTAVDAATGTLVLYTAAWDADESEYYVTSVEAAVNGAYLTATWRNAISFVADGETYKYSANGYGSVSASDVEDKVEQVALFDNYGYVIYVDDVAPEADPYAIVLATDYNSAALFETDDVWYAKLLYIDGTVGTVEIPAADGALAYGTIVTYAEGTGANKGKIDLTLVDELDAAALTVKTNDTKIGTADVNSKTIFVVKTTNPITRKPVYTVYTGIANIPALTATGYAWAAARAGYAAVVFVDGAALSSDANTAKHTIYVDGAYTVATDVEVGTYYTYAALVDGEVTTLKTAEVELAGWYKDVTYNKDGLIDGATAMTDNAATKLDVLGTASSITAASNGVIGIGGVNYAFNDATAVYKVNAVTGAITASSVAAIKTDSTDVAVNAYVVNNVLAMIMIVE